MPKGPTTRTRGYLLGRVAEMFGIDPTVIEEHWSPAKQRYWMWYVRVRLAEEAERDAARMG